MNPMHDEPTYHRSVGPDGEEVGQLGYDCGSHCGVIRTGNATHVGHCPCTDCHGEPHVDIRDGFGRLIGSIPASALTEQP